MKNTIIILFFSLLILELNAQCVGFQTYKTVAQIFETREEAEKAFKENKKLPMYTVAKTRIKVTYKLVPIL